VLAPRGRRFDRTLEHYLALAAKRREQLTAVVTSAVDLDQAQRERLANALQGIYGKQVLLQVVLDPKVIGGIHVQIGDEVVDGTVLRKIDAARRHLAG
jgi:F-type H+-transporting ATPase subunit delta